jgi:hypothetical protein
MKKIQFGQIRRGVRAISWPGKERTRLLFDYFMAFRVVVYGSIDMKLHTR